MQTKVIIEGGEVTHDVLDGQGVACRQGTDPYMKALQERFGLSDDQVNEDCKPEMQQTAPVEQKLEGEHLA